MASKAAEVAKLLITQDKENNQSNKIDKNKDNTKKVLDQFLVSWEKTLTIFSNASTKLDDTLTNVLAPKKILENTEEKPLELENLNKVLSPIIKNDTKLGTKTKPLVITFDKAAAELIESDKEKETKPSIISSQNEEKIIKPEKKEKTGIDLTQLLTGMNTILSKLLNPVAFFTSIVAEFLPYFILGFFFFKGFLKGIGIDIMNLIKPALAILRRFNCSKIRHTISFIFY